MKLVTAGNETITATDTSNNSILGTVSLTVNPAAATHLVFGQQPTNAAMGVAITPAVTVKVLDAYNNLVTTDNTDKVTITLASNSSGGMLSGTATATVINGTATFSNLSINAAGSGYVLDAVSGSLVSAVSAGFSVNSVSSSVIESFDSNPAYYVVGGYSPTAYLSTAAKHDGTYGLVDTNGNDWIYRNDSAVQVKEGDTVSVWLQFSGSADGRAYFGFGAGPNGTLSLVAAPNTNQLLIQNNAGYGFANIGAVSQTWQANHWYRLEVDWGTSGNIVGKLFDSNGTTLLNTVSASTTAITSGGIAFRATGSNKYWDTVQLTPGANIFVHPTVAASSQTAVSSSIINRIGAGTVVNSGRGSAIAAAAADAIATSKVFSNYYNNQDGYLGLVESIQGLRKRIIARRAGQKSP